MITFIIPSYSNPKGLVSTLLSIKENAFVSSTEALVLLDKTDIHLQENITICNSTALHPMRVRSHVFETPSLTARVNYASFCITTPFACVLNDDIILEKGNSPIETLISEACKDYTDLILVLYLCMSAISDNGYAFPIVSRRVIDLLGYLYHPICASQMICERWIGSIFHELDRIIPIKGVPLTFNEAYPSRITVNEEVVKTAELLYNSSGAVRRGTAESLKRFMI